MTIRVAIVADDLTGALDTSAPLVDAGLSVAVALDVEAVEEAIETGADVIVVNTLSRALAPVQAAERVVRAAILLKRASPEFVFKKIDSRLKGNVAAESEALAASFNRRRLLVAPAVPDQGRHTRAGHVVGFGVAEPLPIEPLFAGCEAKVRIADAASDADLDHIVSSVDGSKTIAVGARGLGSALARRLATRSAKSPFEPCERTLFAFGSRDPITGAQMDALLASGLIRDYREAPLGEVPADGRPAMLPMLLRCSGEVSDAADEVAQRFAAGASRIANDAEPDMVMMGGGDTAYAILRSLGARVLAPKGEIEAGIPWFEAGCSAGRRMRCAVKSGGFGNPQSLIKILQDRPETLQVGQ
ncbi:four-carbon acid sugar kinase family protein [Ensifer aridi]|uniref:four-carbon acid sugar kinase family protein n=1 Tax=Ensifer aridi TaxID=1708715 RepID=UPI0009BD1DC9|nr:four-carbon acid sugar kinase family protein [Ensifer aridi]